MADDVHPPVHLGNFVSMLMNADELTMEVRRLTSPHSPQVMGAQITVVPPPKLEDIFKVEPIARVVLTYTAAKALKEYLESVWPRIERARREGKGVE